MKKIIICLIILCSIFTFGACTQNIEKKSKTLTNYDVILTLNTENYSMNGLMKIEFINSAEMQIDNLCFNLYPSAFREGSNQQVISSAKESECYYNGVSHGGISISSVLGNNILGYSIVGSNENILKVDLKNKLSPQSYECLTIEFSIVLPNISHRFGYGENTINLGNFLPIACVFENGTWVEMEYSSNGDPFYSECANYNVEISYPKEFIIASSGVQESTIENGPTKTTKITADIIRDFAIILSKNYQIASQTIGDTTIKYFYYNDLDYSQSLQVASLAVKTFNSMFGDYPYKELSVCQGDFCIGGMEFPNLVLIGDNIESKENYQYVIVHEIAHQWWYGVVGNNQTKYSWLDEGLAEFSSALFYEKNNEFSITYDLLLENANLNYQTFQKAFQKVYKEFDASMQRNINDFSTEAEYVNLVYIKGFLLFDSLKQSFGEKMIVKCLKNYYNEYSFKIATPFDLIAVFENTTSCKLESYFNTWLTGKTIQPTT